MTLRSLVIVALAASPCSAVIIQGTELPPYTAVTNQLGVGYGAVFSSLNSPFVTFTELIPGTWGIQGTEPWSSPAGGYSWYNSPIFVNFVDPSDGVTPAVVNGTISCLWGDGGGDLDAVDMRAYDIGGNLITSATFTGVSFTPIQITANGIRRVEFWANTNVGAPTSDTGLDWISYSPPVSPAPSTAALLGLAGLAACRRRRA